MAPSIAMASKAHFGNCLDSMLSKLDINVRTIGDTSRAVSLNGGFMSFPQSDFTGGNPDSSLNLSSPGVASTVGHEMLHQLQRVNGVNVTSQALGLQIQYSLGLSYPYNYSASTDPQTMLNTFKNGNVEQQGQMFQDYLLALLSGGNTSAFDAIANFVKSDCSCGK